MLTSGKSHPERKIREGFGIKVVPASIEGACVPFF
jgi:hypothetical protein